MVGGLSPEPERLGLIFESQLARTRRRAGACDQHHDGRAAQESHACEHLRAARFAPGMLLSRPTKMSQLRRGWSASTFCDPPPDLQYDISTFLGKFCMNLLHQTVFGVVPRFRGLGERRV